MYETLFFLPPTRRQRLCLSFSLLSRSPWLRRASLRPASCVLRPESCDLQFPPQRLRSALLVLLLIGNLKRLVTLRCQEAAGSQPLVIGASQFKCSPCTNACLEAKYMCAVCAALKLYASRSNNGNKQAFFIHQNFAHAKVTYTQCCLDDSCASVSAAPAACGSH